MKVKLLKKIRNRYSITRVDAPSSNEDKYILDYIEKHGLPIFILENHESSFSRLVSDRTYLSSLDEARTRLMETILKDYSEKFRHVPRETIKVWWK